ncbi:CsgG/HfaB family protein [Piscinibacter sp. XHJ-5]|uniref:CsgG/HfaB family protein n=1 Tax=Piscinibacter sp. XHJ-5 TaxID=3037797 RepID=UPI002452AEDB|nr:CsgG/HfaB family protein [Piscinibacter sp. XHJ-5]
MRSHATPAPAFGCARISIAAAALILGGCLATTPEIGGGSKTAVTGAAGGATAENANSSIERCDQSLGTLGVVEDQNAPWYHQLRSYKLGSTVPVIRMMIQQSNCFVIVERGGAMQNMRVERDLEKTGEMRSGSNFQKGQMVAADYTMSPSIQFSQNTGGGRAGLAGFLPGAFAAVAGSMKTNEASTTLIMIDNRSGVQLAAAEGSAKNMDFNLMGAMFGGGAGGGAGGYSNTPEGKIIIAAFADSYNQLVRAVRNYKAQTVKGGLGTGGTLGVSGGSTPASKEVSTKKKQ